MLHEGVRSGLGGLVLHVDTAWNDHITAVCPAPTLQVYSRRTYRLDARGGSWGIALPADFRLRLVDAALLADGRVHNMAYLTEEMVSERPSIDDFLAKSFGVCLLHENEIVGWCLSEYNCGLRLIHHSYATLTGADEETEMRLKYVELWFSATLPDLWEVRTSRSI